MYYRQGLFYSNILSYFIKYCFKAIIRKPIGKNDQCYQCAEVTQLYANFKLYDYAKAVIQEIHDPFKISIDLSMILKQGKFGTKFENQNSYYQFRC